MLSKLFATIFVLLLLSVLRRLREDRLEAEFIVKKQRQANQLKTQIPLKAIRRNKKIKRKLRGKYSAITINAPDNACEKVKNLIGHRFLAKDAPLMPLQHCPRRNVCNCVYEYHSDRRSSDERSSFNIEFGILPYYEEGENKSRRWYDNVISKAS